MANKNAGPGCPRHGDLALRLALGEIPFEGAARAEAERASAATVECPTCRSWWRDNLELEAVTAGVAAGLEDFRPRLDRVSVMRWGALAAGLILVASTLSLRLVGGGADGETTAPAARVDDRPGVELAASRKDESRVLFADGMESGSLADWSHHDSQN